MSHKTLTTRRTLRALFAGGASLLSIAAAAPAFAQDSSGQVQILRSASEIADGKQVLSISKDVVMARRRDGDRSLLIYDTQNGVATLERGGKTTVSALKSRSGPELSFAYDYATKSLSGDGGAPLAFNAWLRPLAAKSPALGADASWGVASNLNALGVLVAEPSPLVLNLKRTYTQSEGRPIVILEYEIPAFKYRTPNGETVVHWARGMAVTDADFSQIQVMATQHRANVIGADGAMRPVSVRNSLHDIRRDGSASMRFDNTSSVQSAINRIVEVAGERTHLVAAAGDNSVADSFPTLLASYLDAAAFAAAEGGANPLPISSGVMTGAAVGSSTTLGAMGGQPQFPSNVGLPNSQPALTPLTGPPMSPADAERARADAQRQTDAISAMITSLGDPAPSAGGADMTPIPTDIGLPSNQTTFTPISGPPMSPAEADRIRADAQSQMDAIMAMLTSLDGPGPAAGGSDMTPIPTDIGLPSNQPTLTPPAGPPLSPAAAERFRADAQRRMDAIMEMLKNLPEAGPEGGGQGGGSIGGGAGTAAGGGSGVRLQDPVAPYAGELPAWLLEDDPGITPAEKRLREDQYRQLVADLERQLEEARKIVEQGRKDQQTAQNQGPYDTTLDEFYENNAYLYESMVGIVATDLSRWAEWLMTQNLRQLERLAQQAGYPNLASALADADNLIRQADDDGYRKWALQPPSCSGLGGCGPSYLERWAMKQSTVWLGDILADSRDIFSSGGFSDIGVAGLDLRYLLRDHGSQDGDIVRVRITQFGRQVYEGEINLTNAGENFNLGVGRGVASLEIFAVNEGTASPNTAQINVANVVRGEGIQTYSLRTGESATLRIEAGAKAAGQ